MEPLLEIEELYTNFHTYEGVVRALNGVSLTVYRGETFGLVGESGCGKSVTVRSAMRIIQPPGRIESGRVLLHLPEKPDEGPVDLLAQPEAYMREIRGDRISMIFQEPNAALNPIMSIGEQVSESFLFHQKGELAKKVLKDLSGPEGGRTSPLDKLLIAIYRLAARDPGAPLLRLLSRLPILSAWDRPLKAEAMARSVAILHKLSVPNPEEIVRRFPHNLSGGMKQRVVIAMGLACSPLLLIADEATSNLDVTIQAQILELLGELKRETISSILIITHDLGVVAETCDRVGVMYAGNLCEEAKVADLFENPSHPYTQALLAAVPRAEVRGELKSIEGQVPNLVDPPPGCRFHPRCPHAMDICKQRFPGLTDLGDGHRVACYLYGG